MFRAVHFSFHSNRQTFMRYQCYVSEHRIRTGFPKRQEVYDALTGCQSTFIKYTNNLQMPGDALSECLQTQDTVFIVQMSNSFLMSNQ